MGNERARIYVMTHKEFIVPDDPMYVPVHVGRKPWLDAQEKAVDSGRRDGCQALLTYTGDDSGDNISDQNCYYSELTGLYWVWKNVRDMEYVGTCHYRRYLLHQGRPFTEQGIVDVLSNYDVITTKTLQLNYSYYEGFCSHHKPMYLDETARVIAERYPEYHETFSQLVHEKHTYFGNMLICRKELYDAYCTWLFDILFELQRRIKVEEEDSYHRRIFGFISEFLQYVWIVHNRYRVYECMVGMLGEKVEVTEVKRRLAQYFSDRDVDGAKAYFLEARRKRPDILMEASDITGELHLAMEVISIAGLEQEAYGTNLLERNNVFGELMAYCNMLNRYAAQRLRGDIEPEVAQWIENEKVTEVAISVALSVMDAAKGQTFHL